MTITSTGLEYRPVGLGRIAILKFMTAALQLRNEQTFKELLDAKLFEKTQDLFLRSPTNSLLHNQYVLLLSAVLEPPTGLGFQEVDSL